VSSLNPEKTAAKRRRQVAPGFSPESGEWNLKAPHGAKANAVGEYGALLRPIRGFREKACIPRGKPRGYSPAPLRGCHILQADSIDHAAKTSAISAHPRRMHEKYTGDSKENSGQEAFFSTRRRQDAEIRGVFPEPMDI